MVTSFTFVFAVAILGLANAESLEQKFKRYGRECRSADALTPRSLCFNVKIGVIKSNGDIDRNKLKAALNEISTFNKASIDDAVANCGEKFGETAAEASMALDQCLDRHLKQTVRKANAETMNPKINRFSSECHSENALSPHILCMYVKLGVMKSNRDIDKNTLKASLKEMLTFTNASIDNAVANCGNVSGETAAAAAITLNECLNNHLKPIEKKANVESVQEK